MSTDDLSKKRTLKEPLASSSVYIGMSNTRGVIMQIHLHRFQQALLANLTGLAAVAGWLSLGHHPTLALLGCVVGCGFAININRLWVGLIKDTVVNLSFWSEQLNDMILRLGIKDYLMPGSVIQRKGPTVRPNRLYRPLKQCNVAWGALLLVALHALVRQEGVTPWKVFESLRYLLS